MLFFGKENQICTKNGGFLVKIGRFERLALFKKIIVLFIKFGSLAHSSVSKISLKFRLVSEITAVTVQAETDDLYVKKRAQIYIHAHVQFSLFSFFSHARIVCGYTAPILFRT